MKAVKVPMKVSEISCLAVVYTGATVSVLNKVKYEQIPDEIRPPLTQGELKLNVAEKGQDMTVSGITNIDVELGGLKLTWPVYVAPIRDDFLLGWDMISHHKFVIDPEKGLCVQQNWLKSEEESSSKETASIGVVRQVTLPTSAEFVSSHQGQDLVIGDVVYRKCTPVKKLEKPWDGPYIILKMVSPSVYLIRGCKKNLVTHHDRLKRCLIKKEELPRWARKVLSVCGL